MSVVYSRQEQPVTPEHDAVPRAVRRTVYVLAVVANATAVTLHGFDVISADHLVAVLAGLGILSSGLALGYVPNRGTTPIPDGAGRHRA